jgi:hypothetical protein
MLTIRKAQMDVFSLYALAQFEAQMAAYLESAFPERFLRSPELPEQDRPVMVLVRQGIERAGRYQIKSERDVARLIELMVMLGPDFDTQESMSWAKKFLQDPSLPGSAKMDFLMQQLTVGEHTGILPRRKTHG